MRNLAELRRAASLTQHSLSKLAKVSRARIAHAETGSGELTGAENRRIFTVLVRRIERNLAALNEETFAEEDAGVPVP